MTEMIIMTFEGIFSRFCPKDRSLKVKKRKRFLCPSISRLPYPGKPHAFVLSEGFPSNSLRFHACSRTGSNAPPVGTTQYPLSEVQKAMSLEKTKI